MSGATPMLGGNCTGNPQISTGQVQFTETTKGYVTSLYTTCNTCLTTKGWFRGPAAPGGHGYYWIVSGQFLNKYPPKYAIAKPKEPEA